MVFNSLLPDTEFPENRVEHFLDIDPPGDAAERPGRKPKSSVSSSGKVALSARPRAAAQSSSARRWRARVRAGASPEARLANHPGLDFLEQGLRFRTPVTTEIALAAPAGDHGLPAADPWRCRPCSPARWRSRREGLPIPGRWKARPRRRTGPASGRRRRPGPGPGARPRPRSRRPNRASPPCRPGSRDSPPDPNAPRSRPGWCPPGPRRWPLPAGQVV